MHSFVGAGSNDQVAVGQTVKVSYSPTNPSIAHDLSISGTTDIYVLCIGLIMTVAGVASFLIGFRAVHRKVGLPSAREGDGWVGQQHVHSRAGVGYQILGAVFFFALIIIAHW
jgi:hypothetical protein